MRRARGSSPGPACGTGRRSPAAAWRSTGSTAGSPRGVQVLAEIPDLFGPGETAQMTYYETPQGRASSPPALSTYARSDVRLRRRGASLENLWARLVTRMIARAHRHCSRWLVGCSALAGEARSAIRPRSSASSRATALGRFRPQPVTASSSHLRAVPGRSASRRPRQRARARLILTPPGRRCEARELARRATLPGEPATTRDTRPAREAATGRSFFFHAERHEEPRGRIDLRLRTAEGADLRERAGPPTRSSSAPCGARATARLGRRRPARSCAGTRTSSARRATKRGLKPLRRRQVPARCATHAGSERDAPRVVHRRTPQRVRDHAPAARAVRDGSPAPRLLRAAEPSSAAGDSARALAA